MSIENISLFELVEQCIATNEEAINKKGITIYKEVVDQSLSIEADKELLERAVNSIFDNAIKYSDDQGVVRIKVSKNEGQTLIECYDNGRGFTQEAMDNLYKPFGLGEQHFDNNYGLSLKAAKLIMETHKGEIRVENLKEGGACVSLIL